ncbi:MAG: MotA/TolQ/ExbB proton channel family protein [Gemmataceae bacterium]
MHAFQEFVTKEWYFAVPMLGMSCVAFALVVWRVLLNRNANSNLNRLLPEIQDQLAKGGVRAALQHCKSTNGLIPKRLLATGLEVSPQGLAASRRSMANVIELEIVPQLNYLLPTILAIAKIATMVGLLGTVISMIGTFDEIQRAVEQSQTGGESNKAISGSSGKIGLALFATALGLVTAIPLVFTHVLFKAWVANFEIKMKYSAQKLLVLLQAASNKPKTGPTAKPTSQPQVNVKV